MKKLILSLSLLSVFTAHAGVITCSNNASSPGQYTSLQDAVDNANAYDTILVQGSSTNYAATTALIIKYNPVTIIGAGYNNPNGLYQFTNVGQIYITHAAASISGSGTKLIGLEITQILFGSHNGGTSVTASATLQDITIERCKFNNVTGGYYNTSLLFGWNVGGPRIFDNISIVNCYFQGLSRILRVDGGVVNGISLDNCLFDNAGVFTSIDIDLSNLIVTNCIFSNFSSQNMFQLNTTVLQKMVLINNIFFKVDPSGCSNCVFDNNITYLCNNDNLLHPGNIGSTGGGNLIGQDPQFVNFPIGVTSFNYSYNLNLQAGSPVIGSGANGTDMGIYGGVAPFEVGANPAIPQIEEITTPLGSTVSQGTNLNVTFKSYKQD
jgi:hypothetical protein